jgi:protein gp37
VSDVSAIEWTDETWNPVTGCSRVSPGCANCYIERTPPFRMQGRRFATVGQVSTTGVTLHPDRLDKPLRWRKPRRVFVCSLADLFHDDVPDGYIDDVFATMLAAPQHTFQVLTKRPERAREWFGSAVSSFDTPTRVWSIAANVLGATREHGGWPSETWPLPNVWLGVSIENARYTWRADVLREIPAAVRFISAEPLLGSLFDAGRGGGRPAVGWLIAR